MKEQKHYAERDAMALGKFYTAHVSAMTREKLFTKSDIAAELAYRDKIIADLKEKTKWHPIETAPKGGHTILVDMMGVTILLITEHGDVVSGNWMCDRYGFGQWFDYGSKPIGQKVTHWMPLPDTPKECASEHRCKNDNGETVTKAHSKSETNKLDLFGELA